jgi:bifunctional N-acetylglucosamine-1-phosphate-uridyltransferase/glucosamine-1-phosphate-acetyltransferase GlmU-like protein
MKKNMKAIVLAAGKGTRLQTENCDLPKVMRLATESPCCITYWRASALSPRRTR